MSPYRNRAMVTSWSRSALLASTRSILKIRNGELKSLLPYKLPLILGNDLAGVVVQTGLNVQRFKPGDEVYAKPSQDRIGTFAEYIAVTRAMWL
jgi:NADPH:quinone reductase-like Zn-dependent oxidoreductase